MAISNTTDANHAIAVDVRPARATASPFRALKIYAAALATAIFGLGIWKLWELIVIAQTWYGANRTAVNAGIVIALLILVVLTVVGVMARLRARQTITKRVQANAKVIERERNHDLLSPNQEALENVERGEKAQVGAD